MQALYTGENVGHDYDELDTVRLRYFGGTTNHWQGYCAPLAAMDFQIRDWVPHSGWPITRSDLEPFYRRASPICQLGPYGYGKQALAELGVRPYDFDPAEIASCLFRFSPPTRFGEVYRSELERATNIRVVLHANVANIQANEAASAVRYVDVRSLDGKAGRVKANAYVLACGGIENARLLLLSDGVERAGLGNRHDLVGRFFMEHPFLETGVVVTDDVSGLAQTYAKRSLAGVEFQVTLCAGNAMQKRERVLNSHVYLDAVAAPGPQAARRLWGKIKSWWEIGETPENLAEDIWRAVRDIGDVAEVAYHMLLTGQRGKAYAASGFLQCVQSCEQAPNPSSRVTLANEKDSLGLRRSQLDWRLTDLDRRTFRPLTESLAAEFTRLNIGRVRLADWMLGGKDPLWGSDMSGGRHHMGTTRMAAEPERGVVDADCRVHHLDNLYIAGSSVFPTGGSVNPTLTIVALAVRLADHLKGRLA